MPKYIHLSFLLISLCYSSTIFAFSSQKLDKQPIVDEIEITGLWRTKPSVVRRELLFRENDILTTKDLLTSIQRLKNLQIFSKVIPLLQLKPKNKVKLILEMQEKWTTIPYMSISGGGGTTYIYGGVYDINTLGRYIETGAQYDNWNGRHGGIAWMRDPRFLNQRLLFGFDLWTIQRVRQLYASNADSQGDYTLETKKINLLLKKEITPNFQIGTALEINNSNITESNPNELAAPETIQLLTNNNKATRTFSSWFIELGKLNYDNYLVEGKFSTFRIKYSNETLGSTKSTTQLDWTNRIFWRLPYHGNAGIRLNAGWTNTQELQDLYYIGGFSNIRGYLDGQFRSKTYLQANAEYRIPSFRNNWLVLQHIFFIDVARTGNHLNDLKLHESQHVSAGIGLRIISPRIYSFNGRFDIAIFSSDDNQSYFSFGSQQYF